MRLILLICSFGVFNAALSDDHAKNVNDRKVCVINLKKNAGVMMSQLKETNCAAGDILYLSETQLIGMTQHTTAMVSAQVCDMAQPIIPFALQANLSTICTYSGQVIPLGGSRDILRLGGFHKDGEKLHTLIKD